MKISPKLFLEYLLSKNINFFTGVPDSLLKYFCLCLDENQKLKENHIIAPNEGSAIALAAGYHIGTQKIPLVYMQNSGIGNAINPILSLVDKDIYSIPMIILVGWRGEPGKKDEPQHIKQGQTQESLLDAISLPYDIISSESDYKKIINRALSSIKSSQGPHVILIKKQTFSSVVHKNKSKKIQKLKLSREDALKIIIKNISKDSIVVSTTGKTSREIFEIREKNKESHKNDFLTIGSMGHSSSIALGIAKSNPKISVYCIDGDGAMIMHMGALSMIGKESPPNLKHILINNYVHESVGGQKTAADIIDFNLFSQSMKYKKYFLAMDSISLKEKIKKVKKTKEGPVFFEIQVKVGSRPDLGRPSTSPTQNKKALMSKINELSK